MRRFGTFRNLSSAMFADLFKRVQKKPQKPTLSPLSPPSTATTPRATSDDEVKSHFASVFNSLEFSAHSRVYLRSIAIENPRRAIALCQSETSLEHVLDALLYSDDPAKHLSPNTLLAIIRNRRIRSIHSLGNTILGPKVTTLVKHWSPADRSTVLVALASQYHTLDHDVQMTSKILGGENFSAVWTPYVKGGKLTSETATKLWSLLLRLGWHDKIFKLLDTIGSPESISPELEEQLRYMWNAVFLYPLSKDDQYALLSKISHVRQHNLTIIDQVLRHKNIPLQDYLPDKFLMILSVVNIYRGSEPLFANDYEVLGACVKLLADLQNDSAQYDIVYPKIKAILDRQNTSTDFNDSFSQLRLPTYSGAVST
ncbi:hypothetical protein CANCADRAFT_4539 [Tortispora caseinolytica NRRL Y-17796]|uniref:Uncharacterized protein n=1 Tax=Tortispora caseinolytica NRRL Y-17796 TaxID=767744 RepID=A0A1E4T9L5_9ASCO|nr:hypothetical protein CANCADRAFT_4539 [Tortispora caseinolytica NRRL Y-17796]